MNALGDISSFVIGVWAGALLTILFVILLIGSRKD